jgi:ferritin
MIGEKVTAALNLQMNREFYNARLYLSMAAYFHSINLGGAAQGMESQSLEETGHAMRLYKHLQERGARILLTAIDVLRRLEQPQHAVVFRRPSVR